MDERPFQLSPSMMKEALIKAGLRRKPVAKWTYFLLALMLICAPFANEPNYFYMLRFAVCGGCGYIAYTYKGSDIEAGWFWVMVVLAITFNPFLPFQNSRGTWALIDLGAAAFLMLALRRDHQS